MSFRPAQPGTFAMFFEPYEEYRRVQFFDEDNDPLVARPDTGKLTKASALRGYVGIRDEDPEVVGVHAGDGSRIKKCRDDGTVEDYRVIFWGLRTDGNVAPAIFTGEHVHLYWGRLLDVYRPDDDENEVGAQ
jgi:hypothetical protein